MIETAVIFPEGKYTWVTLKQSITLNKGAKAYPMKKGSTVGIRPATSKKGVYRLVSKDYSVTIVFTLDQNAVNKLAGSPQKTPGAKAKPIKELKVEKESSDPIVNNAKLPAGSLQVVADPKIFLKVLIGKGYSKSKWNEDYTEDMIQDMMERFDPISKWFNDNYLYEENWAGLIKLCDSLAPCFKVKVNPGYVFRGLSLKSKYQPGSNFTLVSKKPASWAIERKVAEHFCEATEEGFTGFVLATSKFKSADVMYSAAHSAAFNKIKTPLTALLKDLAKVKGLSNSEASRFASEMQDNAADYLASAEKGEVILRPGSYATVNVWEAKYEEEE